MTKERLRNYRTLLREKESLEQQIETVEATLFSPKIQKIKQTPGGRSGGNAMEDLAAKHMELIDLYQDKLTGIATELLEIERAIDALPPTERNLMRLYYINGKTWEEVCVAIGYAWAQTHRIHSRALRALDSCEK